MGLAKGANFCHIHLPARTGAMRVRNLESLRSLCVSHCSKMSITISDLPQELILHIANLTRSVEGVRALSGLCATNASIRQTCSIPFLRPSHIGPSLVPYLESANGTTGGGALVSPLQVVQAAQRAERAQLETTCVRFALYSAMVLSGFDQGEYYGLNPLLTLDQFARQDDPQTNNLFYSLVADITLEYHYLVVTIDVTGRRQVRFSPGGWWLRWPCSIPDQHARDVVNGALSQALYAAVINTDSAEQTPALCTNVDLFRAYPQAAQCVRTSSSEYVDEGKHIVYTVAVDLASMLYPRGRPPQLSIERQMAAEIATAMAGPPAVDVGGRMVSLAAPPDMGPEGLAPLQAFYESITGRPYVPAQQ